MTAAITPKRWLSQQQQKKNNKFNIAIETNKSIRETDVDDTKMRNATDCKLPCDLSRTSQTKTIPICQFT